VTLECCSMSDDRPATGPCDTQAAGSLVKHQLLSPATAVKVFSQTWKKPLEKFFVASMLIAGIHVSSVHYGKAKTTRVVATLGIDFRGHFEGHKSPSGLIVEYWLIR